MGFRVLIDSMADERDKFSSDPDVATQDEAIKKAFETIGAARAPGGDYHITLWPKDERGIPTGPVVKFSCTMSWVQVVVHKAEALASPAAAMYGVGNVQREPTLLDDLIASSGRLPWTLPGEFSFEEVAALARRLPPAGGLSVDTSGKIIGRPIGVGIIPPEQSGPLVCLDGGGEEAFGLHSIWRGLDGLATVRVASSVGVLFNVPATKVTASHYIGIVPSVTSVAGWRLELL